MAPISVNVVSTFLIVLIGSQPCRPLVCTNEIMNKCRSDNTDSTTNCVSYNKTLLCLGELLQNCKDDSSILAIKSYIKYDERNMAQCPGLPDGKCFVDELIDNCGKISTNISIFRLGKDILAEDCNAFSEKSSYMRTCTKNLKLKCVYHVYLTVIDEQLQNIDDAEKVCADFKKSSEH